MTAAIDAMPDASANPSAARPETSFGTAPATVWLSPALPVGPYSVRS